MKIQLSKVQNKDSKKVESKSLASLSGHYTRVIVHLVPDSDSTGLFS